MQPIRRITIFVHCILAPGGPHPPRETEDAQKVRLQEARILVIDDEPANLAIIQRTLMRGFDRNVTASTDAREAARVYGAVQPDLLLLDLDRPRIHDPGAARAEASSGARYLFPERRRDIRGRAPCAAEGLAVGARDFVNKPFDELELMLRIWNQLKTRFPYLDLQRSREGPR